MELFYRKYGSGPPMFILHGLFGSSDNWVTIAKKLAEDFTVYLPDQRNHGGSPHSEIHDYESMSHDLYELTEALNVRKLFLAGHSMGGKVAVNFALKWPEKINSLVIIDVSPFILPVNEHKFYDENRNILESIMSVDLTGIKTRSQVEEQIGEKIKSEKVLALIMKNIQRTTNSSFSWKMNVRSLYNNLHNMVTGLPRPTRDTEMVTGFPVTVIKGGNSDYLPPGEFDAIRLLFPAAELITLQNTGHWVQAEKPDEVIEVLRNQLKA
jgi:esterase